MGRGRKILKRNDLKDREKGKRKGTQILKRNNSKDGEKWKRRGAEDPKRNDLKGGGKVKRKGPKILKRNNSKDGEKGKRKEHRVSKRAFVLLLIFFVILAFFFVVLSILCGNKFRSRTLQFIKLFDSFYSVQGLVFFIGFFCNSPTIKPLFFSRQLRRTVCVCVCVFPCCSFFQSEI